MRSQTDPGGNELLDIRPRSFLGGLSNARLTTEILGSEYTPETASGAKSQQRRNALFGMVSQDNIISTPRLTNPWYLFADPMEAPAIEVAFLDGEQDPAVDQFDRRNPDGISLLVRHDYGVACIDWRGAYRNPGA
jgi:hypothetical protein